MFKLFCSLPTHFLAFQALCCFLSINLVLLQNPVWAGPIKNPVLQQNSSTANKTAVIATIVLALLIEVPEEVLKGNTSDVIHSSLLARVHTILTTRVFYFRCRL